jgi:hypothetical protein
MRETLLEAFMKLVKLTNYKILTKIVLILFFAINGQRSSMTTSYFRQEMYVKLYIVS